MKKRESPDKKLGAFKQPRKRKRGICKTLPDSQQKRRKSNPKLKKKPPAKREVEAFEKVPSARKQKQGRPSKKRESKKRMLAKGRKQSGQEKADIYVENYNAKLGPQNEKKVPYCC